MNELFIGIKYNYFMSLIFYLTGRTIFQNSRYRVYAIGLLFFINSQIAFAQSFDWMDNNFPGSRFLGVYQIDDELYAAVSNGSLWYKDSTANFQLKVYQVNFEKSGQSGIFLNEFKTIPNQDNFGTNALEFIPNTGEWLATQTRYVADNRQSFRILLFDKQFKLKSTVNLDTVGNPDPFHISTNNDKTFILGSLGPPNFALFYNHYDHSGHLSNIQITQSDPKPISFITDMKSDNLTGSLLVYFISGITVMDTTLHQSAVYDYFDIGARDHGHLLQDENYFYVHGCAPQKLNVPGRWLVLHKFDSSFHQLKADTLGRILQDNYPFITSSIDKRNNRILVGGHLDGPLTHLYFGESIKKYYLAEYDTQLNQLWYKEYGGDKAYVMFGAKILNDNSCLAYGYVTDTSTFERYAYIMHVDENGEILTSTTMPNQPKTSIQVVNPGDEILRILNPDHVQGRIELYDIQGCHVLTGEISSEISEINTQDLPAGLYPYVLIKDGHSIGSGKWIKAK